jgi:hypothetical protein
MVLNRSELLNSLRHEVRVFLHLAGKLDRSMLDYRPTPRQRSTIELLRYLTMMGPALVQAARAGAFDPAAWQAAGDAAAKRDFDQALAAIAEHADTYATLLDGISDAAWREQIEIFGTRTTRGSFIVNHVLCGCAAYRMQLFLYLKACGREELGTTNLWLGVDAPAPD